MILCGVPGNYIPKVVTFWEWLGPDKIAHLMMFAAFAFSIMLGYKKEYCEYDKIYRIRLQLTSVLISAAYGGITELLQAYHVFKGRFGSVYDFFADVIGCVLGVLIFKLVFRKKIAKNSSPIQ
ncbi:MAG: VanZ family protein [Bacteroidales bacterium]|nr:VanZ family protein [Bacteroidales bacterium]